MVDSKRHSSIETYYDAIDEEEFDRIRTVMAEDVTYVTAHGEMNGVDSVVAYYTDERTVTNTTHQVVRELRDGDVWVCEGTVSGEYVDGGSFDGKYVGIFDFQPDSEKIQHLSVYTRSVF
jgi:ketosteroid isomerase-like protein